MYMYMFMMISGTALLRIGKDGERKAISHLHSEVTNKRNTTFITNFFRSAIKILASKKNKLRNCRARFWPLVFVQYLQKYFSLKLDLPSFC
jgi:hypothetical protein